jgi:hypothetical protein
MSKFQLFLQFEGDRRVELVTFTDDVDTEAVRAAAVKLGFADLGTALIFAENTEDALEDGRPLREQKVGNKHRLHLHRCPEIKVTLHFVDVTKHHVFRPAATVDRVKRWFVNKIDMSDVDATEHVLQITGTTDRPDPDTHIGSLVSGRCTLEFSLVPLKRIEG